MMRNNAAQILASLEKLEGEILRSGKEIPKLFTPPMIPMGSHYFT